MLGLVPIDPRLRGRDAFMVQNNLTVSLLEVHGDFAARAERRRLLADLLPGRAGEAAAG